MAERQQIEFCRGGGCTAKLGPGALSRVLETPVAEMVLYFFAPGCEVRL